MTNSVEKILGRVKLAGDVTYPIAHADGLPINYGSSFSIEFGEFGPAELKKALTDSEMTTSLLRDHREEMGAILADVVAGRTDTARQRALTIGLTEEAFQQKGATAATSR